MPFGKELDLKINIALSFSAQYENRARKRKPKDWQQIFGLVQR